MKTKIRGRVVRIGDHLAHVPSGEYLGEVVEIGRVVLALDHGPRGRMIATRYEVERCEPPS